MDPRFYEGLIAESNLYDTVVELQWQALSNQVSPAARPIVQGIGFAKFSEVVHEVAPPGFLSGQIGPAVVSFRGWLKGSAPPEDLAIIFSLGEFKKRLPVVVHDVLGSIAKDLPTCSLLELRQLAGGSLVWCRPAFLSATMFARQLEGQLPIQQIMREVPDTITWQQLIAKPGSQSLQHNLLELRQDYQQAKQWIHYVWLGLGVLWLVLVLLLIPWWRLMMEWLGAVVVTIGGIQLALYASLPWLGTFIWQQTAAGWPVASRIGDADKVQELLETILQSLNRGLLNLAVILVVVGVALWLAAHFIKKQVAK